jgi:hypothetical protein
VDQGEVFEEAELRIRIGSDTRVLTVRSNAPLDSTVQHTTPHLPDGVISRPRRLQAFLADDADADISRLYHGDVIAAVTYRQRDRRGILDQGHDICFLLWRDSAADDRAGTEPDPRKFLAAVST